MCKSRERVNAVIAAESSWREVWPNAIDAHRDSVARLWAQGQIRRAIAKELGIPSSNVLRIDWRA